MFIECGNENDRRHFVGPYRPDHTETVQFGHLHVEQDEVGPEPENGIHRAVAIFAFGDDGKLGIPPQQLRQPLARHRLVIDDQNSNHVGHLKTICCYAGDDTVLQGRPTIPQGTRSAWPPVLSIFTSMRRGSFLLLSLIIVAASGVVALVDTAMSLVRVPENTFGWEFPRLLLAWLTLGIFGPVVVFAAHRVRFGRTNVALAVAVHGLLAFLSAGAHYTLLALIHRWYLNNPAPYWRTVRELFLYYAHFDVIAYALIVGCVHAWMSHTEARERELAAETLRADLSEARLQALRTQLNPHFLFNAMNAVAMLVRGGNQQAAVGTLAKLSDLLRRVIRENPSHQVPLRDEIDFVTQYLDIERTRFGDRLSVSIDAPDDTLDVLVPDLVLQPLVENAMRHGVALTGRRCHVSIVARRSNGQLALSVSDDAKGLSRERSSISPGVGLQNTEARLTHLHGGEAHFSVTNNEEGGVTAQLILPISLHRRRASLREPVR